MAGCRIVDASVGTAMDAIADCATAYTSAGEDFISAFNSAISEMEGEAKDALKTFIDGAVSEYVTKNLPDAVNGMFQLLEANRTNFTDVDKQIAESISES